MTDASHPEVLPLSEAVVRWSDQSLVEAVRLQERRHFASQIHTIYLRNNTFMIQLTPDDELAASTNSSWTAGAPNFAGLITAWRALESDFRNRIVRGVLYLRGVQTAPIRGAERVPIDGIRAANFKFGLRDARLRDAEYDYVAVELSRTPYPTVEAPKVQPAVDPLTWTDQQVADLPPAVVANLLERHAEHVRQNLGVSLLPPGKASVMALVGSMMKDRAKLGLSESSLESEASWLMDWAAKVAPSWYTPGKKIISNKLGRLWKQLQQE